MFSSSLFLIKCMRKHWKINKNMISRGASVSNKRSMRQRILGTRPERNWYFQSQLHESWCTSLAKRHFGVLWGAKVQGRPYHNWCFRNDASNNFTISLKKQFRNTSGIPPGLKGVPGWCTSLATCLKNNVLDRCGDQKWNVVLSIVVSDAANPATIERAPSRHHSGILPEYLPGSREACCRPIVFPESSPGWAVA